MTSCRFFREVKDRGKASPLNQQRVLFAVWANRARKSSTRQCMTTCTRSVQTQPRSNTTKLLWTLAGFASPMRYIHYFSFVWNQWDGVVCVYHALVFQNFSTVSGFHQVPWLADSTLDGADTGVSRSPLLQQLTNNHNYLLHFQTENDISSIHFFRYNVIAN